MTTYFTSESVAAGHPDKICDQISDAVVDAALRANCLSRVAVETLVTKDRIVLAGEVTTPKRLDYSSIARKTINRLGYTDPIYGFSDASPVSVYIHEQSQDIARGVDDGGAGDQGMMFGYASDETPEYMPLPIVFSHRLVERMDEVRELKVLPYLRPDGKVEVKIRYENGTPTAIEAIVIAVPYKPDVVEEEMKIDMIRTVITPIAERYKLRVPNKNAIIINGTGKWEIGGPASDTGVTGRKIIVDTYGAFARHGGGCFSGKDPTKVDRSAAYACRYLAKNIVHAKLARRAEVRVAYVIGQKLPIDLQIECFGTEKKPIAYLTTRAKRMLNLSVPGIIEGLHLQTPIYEKTAAYGHFGRDGFPWEAVLE